MPFTFTNRSRRFDEDVDETSLSHGTSFVSLIREETLSLIAGFLSFLKEHKLPVNNPQYLHFQTFVLQYLDLLSMGPGNVQLFRIILGVWGYHEHNCTIWFNAVRENQKH